MFWFSHYRSCDDTLENCFFKTISYSRAYLSIIYEKTKRQVSLAPLLEKQNIQATEVHCKQTFRMLQENRYEILKPRQKKSTDTLFDTYVIIMCFHF